MNLLKFKLRKYCIPKGPSFAKAEQVGFDLSGTQVSLCVPSHSRLLDRFKKSDEVKVKPFYNVFDPHNYVNCEISLYGGFITLARVWEFKGPWLVGNVAELYMASYVLDVPPISNQFTLFRPSIFKDAVLKRLARMYGEGYFYGKQGYESLADWRSITLGNAKGITFSLGSDATGGEGRYYSIPITYRHYLNFYFCKTKLESRDDEDQSALISTATMDELIDKVASTITIELSEESLKEQQRMAARWPEENLSNFRDSIQRRTYEHDRERREFREGFDRFLRRQREQDRLEGRDWGMESIMGSTDKHR